MVAFGYLVQSGVLDGAIKWLSISKYVGKAGSPGEMIILPFVCGLIAIVVGLWQAAVKPKEGQLDYYLSTVGGVMFILIISFVVKWGLDPLMAAWGKAAETAMKDANLVWAFDFAKVMNLNYVVMGIIAGIIAVNVFKIPDWAENGVRLSRLGLKTGVVLLGVLYSWQELANLAGLSVVMIAVFVLGSVGLTLWMGARRNIPNSMGGVLSAGLGVCGVSASVAASPVVNAKSTEIAYTIGTILLWGVLMMFIFPIVGKAMGRCNDPHCGDHVLRKIPDRRGDALHVEVAFLVLYGISPLPDPLELVQEGVTGTQRAGRSGGKVVLRIEALDLLRREERQVHLADRRAVGRKHGADAGHRADGPVRLNTVHIDDLVRPQDGHDSGLSGRRHEALEDRPGLTPAFALLDEDRTELQGPGSKAVILRPAVLLDVAPVLQRGEQPENIVLVQSEPFG